MVSIMFGMPGLFATDIETGLALAGKVDPKYAPVWAGRPDGERAALGRYFLPHRSAKAVLGVTRPRVVKWYCPFADQRRFPSGHRYCINVYVGCSHGCVYCYAAGYTAMAARPKANFRRMLARDLADLDAFDVPPAPLHISNSCDAFQRPLEVERGDALFTLRRLADCRQRFTTVTLLTKDPGVLVRPVYLEALLALGGPAGRVVVEVSLAFAREAVATACDPGAPSVAERVDAIARLRSAGVPVVLRVSPTYPIGLAPPGGRCPQTRQDIDALASFSADVGAEKIVHTPAKIVRPKHGRLHPLMSAMLALYRRLSLPARPDFHGGAWRLPRPTAERYVVAPLRDLCGARGVPVAFCMDHLLATR